MTDTAQAAPPDAAPRRWTGMLMAPGACLMFALHLRSKLLLAAAVLVPMTLLMAISLQVLREQGRVTLRELQGTAVGERLTPTLLDRNGSISVFGSKPQLVGQPSSAIPGLEAASFLAQAWAAADGGGGWTQYDVVSPGTRQVTPKESFILPLGQSVAVGG